MEVVWFSVVLDPTGFCCIRKTVLQNIICVLYKKRETSSFGMA